MDFKEIASNIMEQKKGKLFSASDHIWGTPETRFALANSVAEHYKVLEEEGFDIKKGVADMKYAYVATYGSGKPVIGILGEYDALGNLSQVADCPEKKAEMPGGNGHGCGHNLLGTGALAAALIIKEMIDAGDVSGTVKLFGCPAEESGSGKAFMAREGIFNDVDCALSWHPMDANMAWASSSLANYQVYYSFKGISAHAAAAPQEGRSALDAAELMNVGVQFLREHIIDEARIHYAFMDAGGESANVVQPTAKLLYFIRAPKINQAKDIFERVNKIAQGAALMTETEYEIKIDSAVANYIPNKTLTELLHKNLIETPNRTFNHEEIEYAKRFRSTLSAQEEAALTGRIKAMFPELSPEEQKEMAAKPINDAVFPLVFSDSAAGSTDVGDVSWVVPTGQIMVACETQGTSPHSWQWVANGKSPVAHKGIQIAGEVIATTAAQLMANPELIAEAKDEHEKSLAGETYISPIPKEVKPEI